MKKRRSGTLEAPKEQTISVQDALAVLKRDYYADVASCAADYAKEIDEGKFSDRDEFIEAIDEYVDGAARVIYTHQAMLGVMSSDNDEAIFDEGMEVEFDGSIPWSQIMYFAYRRDILEELDRLGYDVDDDATFEGSDEEDEEDDE